MDATRQIPTTLVNPSLDLPLFKGVFIANHVTSIHNITTSYSNTQKKVSYVYNGNYLLSHTTYCK